MLIGLRQSPENSVFFAPAGVPEMGADADGDPLQGSGGPARAVVEVWMLQSRAAQAKGFDFLRVAPPPTPIITEVPFPRLFCLGASFQVHSLYLVCASEV